VSAPNVAVILLNILLGAGFGFLAIASSRGGGAPQQAKLI